MPEASTFVTFAVGWVLGWLLLWRLRPLPDRTGARSAVAVVVPARDEAANLQHLLPAVTAQLRDGDELVVVDDHSTDGTAEIAASLGARVVPAPELPEGWLGKPHACHTGARSTSAPTLVFLDADVRPAPDLVDRLARAVTAAPERLVSVQPWHLVERADEQPSLLFNVIALMGVGRFAIWGAHADARAAFGPVLGIDRRTYARTEGFEHPAVRNAVIEDLALARVVGAVDLYTGHPDTRFRMYPRGMRQLIEGWTRSFGAGARAIPWWITLLTVLWLASLILGCTAAWVLYPLCVVQLLVLGRRVGSFAPWISVLYPWALAVFLVVFVRSLAVVVLRRDITWKQRRIAAR